MKETVFWVGLNTNVKYKITTTNSKVFDGFKFGSIRMLYKKVTTSNSKDSRAWRINLETKYQSNCSELEKNESYKFC